MMDELSRWLESAPDLTACFPNVVKIYAPTCYGRCLEAVNELIRDVNRVAGGSTVYDAVGSWVEGARLETEPVKVIEAGHCLDSTRARGLVNAIARYGRAANQRAVAVHGNSFYIGAPATLEAATEPERAYPPAGFAYHLRRCRVGQ